MCETYEKAKPEKKRIVWTLEDSLREAVSDFSHAFAGFMSAYNEINYIFLIPFCLPVIG